MIPPGTSLCIVLHTDHPGAGIPVACAWTECPGRARQLTDRLVSSRDSRTDGPPPDTAGSINPPKNRPGEDGPEEGVNSPPGGKEAILPWISPNLSRRSNPGDLVVRLTAIDASIISREVYLIEDPGPRLIGTGDPHDPHPVRLAAIRGSGQARQQGLVGYYQICLTGR